MIVWIASYPKSGNTWVRSFLSDYLNKSKTDFDFSILQKIKRFPRKELYDNLKINYNNFFEIVSNWINMQSYLNLKDETIYLKTHNAMCTINGHSFTNKNNTLGIIYVVRDPRDVILSYSSHLKKNIEDTFQIMTDKHAKGMVKYDGKYITDSILGSWSENYKSWKNCNITNKIIIKYEDLISNPCKYFSQIITYLNKIDDININQQMINKSIENTNFKKLQNLEKKFTFEEKEHGIFFRKGQSGNWKNELDEKIIFQIEEAFKEEMKELRYL